MSQVSNIVCVISSNLASISEVGSVAVTDILKSIHISIRVSEFGLPTDKIWPLVYFMELRIIIIYQRIQGAYDDSFFTNRSDVSSV